MTKLIAAAVLALSLAIGVGAASAGGAARLGTPFEVLLAKSADGNYKRSGSLNLDPKEKKTVFWSVESLASVDLDITFDDAITGDGAPAGYRITWFKGKKQKKDISHDVQTSGYEYTIRAGKTTYFNAEVKALANPQPGFCLGGRGGDPANGYESAYFGLNGPCL